MEHMEIRKQYQITEYCHRFMKEHIREHDCCIDATAGNGGDTLFLCSLVGAGGKVYAFDIQAEALEHTRKRIESAGYSDRAVLILSGHEYMEEYVKEEVGAIVFNFGYLPGGDHAIATKAETSILAVQKGLKLLKRGGIMSLCIYSGGDTGYEERKRLLAFLKELDTKRWLVIVSEFFNRKNDPPVPAFVIRL